MLKPGDEILHFISSEKILVDASKHPITSSYKEMSGKLEVFSLTEAIFADKYKISTVIS